MGARNEAAERGSGCDTCVGGRTPKEVGAGTEFEATCVWAWAGTGFFGTGACFGARKDTADIGSGWET